MWGRLINIVAGLICGCRNRRMVSEDGECVWCDEYCNFFLLFVIDKKSVRVPCYAVLCYMLILPVVCGVRGARVSFATHPCPLESRALCVELLEDFGSLLKSQWRVSENNNLVLTGGIRGDTHILHRVEAA